MAGEPDVREIDIQGERWEIVKQLEDWLEMPMLVLSVVWLALFVVETVWGTGPFLESISNVIWAIFWIDFGVKLPLAPDRWEYLKTNWITAIALLVPALRIFRAFRAFRLLKVARAARGVRFVRLLTSLNRGMKAIGASFGRRGFGYVLVLTLIVMFGGAAGMYGFEHDIDGGFARYSDARWWTAMLLTSIGSDYFPRSGEGRVLCLILAIYGFAVFGYMTATLATFFVQRDVETAGERGEPCIVDLQKDIAELRAEIRQLLAERPAQT